MQQPQQGASSQRPLLFWVNTAPDDRRTTDSPWRANRRSLASVPGSNPAASSSSYDSLRSLKHSRCSAWPLPRNAIESPRLIGCSQWRQVPGNRAIIVFGFTSPPSLSAVLSLIRPHSLSADRVDCRDCDRQTSDGAIFRRCAACIHSHNYIVHPCN